MKVEADTREYCCDMRKERITMKTRSFWKKMTAVLLAVVMAVPMLGVTVLAENVVSENSVINEDEEPLFGTEKYGDFSDLDGEWKLGTNIVKVKKKFTLYSYTFKAPEAGCYYISSKQSGRKTFLSLYESSEIGSGFESGNFGNGYCAEIYLTEGQTYYFQTAFQDGKPGTITVTVSKEKPLYDVNGRVKAGRNRIKIGNEDRLYSFTAPKEGTYYFYTFKGNTFETSAGLWSENCFNPTVLNASETVGAGCMKMSEYLLEGTTYYINISNEYYSGTKMVDLYITDTEYIHTTDPYYREIECGKKYPVEANTKAYFNVPIDGPGLYEVKVSTKAKKYDYSALSNSNIDVMDLNSALISVSGSGSKVLKMYFDNYDAAQRTVSVNVRKKKIAPMKKGSKLNVNKSMYGGKYGIWKFTAKCDGSVFMKIRSDIRYDINFVMLNDVGDGQAASCDSASPTSDGKYLNYEIHFSGVEKGKQYKFIAYSSQPDNQKIVIKDLRSVEP